MRLPLGMASARVMTVRSNFDNRVALPEAAGDRAEQSRSIDRLGDVVVAAGGEALLRSPAMAWAVRAMIGPA